MHDGLETPLMRRAFLLALSLAIMLPLSGAHAASDDLALFSSRTTAPANIMFLVDTSGSMTKLPGDDDSNDEDCGSSYYCKWEMARDVLVDVVLNINPPDGSGGHAQNARFGVFFFDREKNGGRLVVPIADGNTAALISRVAGMDGSKNDPPTGDINSGTPLALALTDVGRYFAGSDGWGSFPVFGTMATYLNGYGMEPSVPNPIDGECRSSYVIALSDGRASDADKFDKFGDDAWCDTIGDADGDGDASCAGPPSGSEDWMDDVSYVMNRTDFAPLIDGTQNLVVHTVAFDMADPAVLTDTAINGGGSLALASDYASLYDAFSGAVISSMDASATFSAAAVPSSRSAFSDVIYTAFFEPDPNDPFWRGHLQAFRLSPDLQILDKNGNPAIDPVTDLFI